MGHQHRQALSACRSEHASQSAPPPRHTPKVEITNQSRPLATSPQSLHGVWVGSAASDMPPEIQNQPSRPPRYNRPHRGGYCVSRQDQPVGPDLSKPKVSESPFSKPKPRAKGIGWSRSNQQGRCGRSHQRVKTSGTNSQPRTKAARVKNLDTTHQSVARDNDITSCVGRTSTERKPPIAVWDQPVSRHDHRARRVRSPAEQTKRRVRFTST